MYHFDGVKCTPADGFTWNFTAEHQVHDHPEVWTGKWSIIDDYKIRITGKRISSPETVVFDLIFINSDLFIGLIGEEVKYSGVRIK